MDIIRELYDKLKLRILDNAPTLLIKNQYIKIKFNDFKLKTCEAMSDKINLECYLNLFINSYVIQEKPIRLLGLGVHFMHKTSDPQLTFIISIILIRRHHHAKFN